MNRPARAWWSNARAPITLPCSRCTLLPYDPQFEHGGTLSEALGSVKLNHPHCAKFCVLGASVLLCVKLFDTASGDLIVVDVDGRGMTLSELTAHHKDSRSTANQRPTADEHGSCSATLRARGPNSALADAQPVAIPQLGDGLEAGDLIDRP